MELTEIDKLPPEVLLQLEILEDQILGQLAEKALRELPKVGSEKFMAELQKLASYDDHP